ncbi:MAG: radical SAM protein [Candidatus Omnitrophica bacterium]|nr:radical SAM protein [Candidatus Omnitrophota bacterium]
METKESSYRMPFKEAAKALYDGKKRGAQVAYFIGGEITLHPDLPQIVAFARKIGYPYIQVMSNALKLSNYAYTKTLVDAGANLFKISLHGYNSKIHDGLVGVQGAFLKVVKSFENIKKLGAEVTVNCTLNKLNYKSVHKFAELITRKFEIEDFNIIFPHYTGMMKDNVEMLKVSVKQAEPYLRKMLGVLERSKAKVENAILINFCPCNLPEATHLMTEWERPDAVLKDEPMYHLEGYTERIYQMKEELRTKNKSCLKCVYNKRCMGFEKWYVDIFGSKEFKPIIKRIKPVNIRPTFRKVKKLKSLVVN